MPSDSELETIEFWNINSRKDCQKLMDFVLPLWGADDWIVDGDLVRVWVRDNFDRQQLIDALKKNGMFWAKSWWQVKRQSNCYVFKLVA